MENSKKNPKRKVGLKKLVVPGFAMFFLILIAAGFIVYHNLNQILSEALLKSFNSNIASDVYELRFDRLKVNLFAGNIKVRNFELLPREKPLRDYSYINSRLQLTTEELLLSDVHIITLLRENFLKLDRIKIERPVLQVTIGDKIPVFLPFLDPISETNLSTPTTKRYINEFILEKFDLINASLHVENIAKERNLIVKNLNINLRDLMLDQQRGYDLMKYSAFSFTIDEITGSFQKESIKSICLKDFGITIDSMKIKKSVDTLIYRFTDFNLGLRDLHVLTSDSLFELSLQTFSVAYADSLVNIEKLAFKPNLSEVEMRKRLKFQHNTFFSGEVEKVQIKGINFDSLIYRNELTVQSAVFDSVSIALFKDKTKPVNKKHRPEYPGQIVRAIAIPVDIGQIIGTNIILTSREIKPDGTPAETHLNRANVKAANITNQSKKNTLSLQMEAYLENIAPFKAFLEFSYQKPEFNFYGSFAPFRLRELNSLISNYAPAKINDGVVDEITFSGKATKTGAKGTMKFVYHDLKMKVELFEKAHWKNKFLSFAANTVVASSNPVTKNLPPKTVSFNIDRDMNKAFVNVVIKSALAGLKETVIMSKENRKAYRNAVKQIKNEKNKQP